MNSPGDNYTTSTMWSLVVRIMVMPPSGWERTMQYGPQPDVAVWRFLTPICLLSGASAFLSRFYYPDLPSSILMVNAVITFCSMFLGYFLSLVIARLCLPADGRGFMDTPYAKLLCMTGIATLALYKILESAFPMLDVLIAFLPVWTIYLLYEGLKITVVSPRKQTFAVCAVCAAVICSPVLLEWIFTMFAQNES